MNCISSSEITLSTMFPNMVKYLTFLLISHNIGVRGQCADPQLCPEDWAYQHR